MQKKIRIIAFNVNGIRAAIKKGLLEWLQTNPADIIWSQETKAANSDVDIAAIEQLGYSTDWFSAQKKGYRGVAVFTKIKPDAVLYGHEKEQSDLEGRVIRLDFGATTLINAYFPSGTSGVERQTYKYQWLDKFLAYLTTLRKTRPQLIITGDYNIEHTEIDINDPKGNKNSSGFLPEERAWMEKFLAAGFIDTFRAFHPTQTGAYSRWSQRFPSVRLQNKGWRIEYKCISNNLKEALTEAANYPDVKHSDHCPVFASLKLNV
jgi:exodeoxyribonuclease-3